MVIYEMAGMTTKIKATYYRINNGLKIGNKIFKIKAIVDPLLKEYRTTGVNYSQPLSASYSKQEKLTPVVIDNIYIPFI